MNDNFLLVSSHKEEKSDGNEEIDHDNINALNSEKDTYTGSLSIYEKLLKFCERENITIEEIQILINNNREEAISHEETENTELTEKAENEEIPEEEEELIPEEKVAKTIDDIEILIKTETPEFTNFISKGDPMMGNHTSITYGNSRKDFLISNFEGYWLFKNNLLIKHHKFNNDYGNKFSYNYKKTDSKISSTGGTTSGSIPIPKE